MKPAISLFLLVACTFFFFGCAHHDGSLPTYTRAQSNTIQTIQEGQVVMVRPVQIEGSQSGVGLVGGGALGYVVGKAAAKNIGSSSGSKAANTAGAIGGAVAGTKVEQSATRKMGDEITVKLDSGEVISVVQPEDQSFNVGDEVKVLVRPDGSARVLQ